MVKKTKKKTKIQVEQFIKVMNDVNNEEEDDYDIDDQTLARLSNFYDIEELLPYVRDDKIPVLAEIVKLYLEPVFNRIVNTELLSQFGISMADSSGNTALLYACANNMHNVAMTLIETGQSNPGHISNHDDTALIQACRNRMREVALKLIGTGQSKPNHIKDGNVTALIYACLNSLSDVSLELIKTGQSNPGHINKDGDTSLIWACQRGLTDVALILIKTGKSNLQHIDKRGNTALDYAKKKNMRLVVLLWHQYKMPIIHKSLSPTSATYDAINMNDVKIKTYILSDINNIAVFVNNNWFLSNKNVIKNLIETHDNVVFKCNSASGVLPPENVDLSKEYFRLKSIGIFLDYVPMTYIYSLLKSQHQYYMLEPTYEILPSVVSYNIYKNGGMWVNGSHCQEGQGGKVYIMRHVIINKPPNKTKKEIDPRLNKYHQSKEKTEKSKQIIKKTYTPSSSSKTRKQQTIHSL